MELVKTDARSITLESYSIEQEQSDGPVTIRAELLLSTPTQTPSSMRLRVKYEMADIPCPNQRDLGRRLIQLLANRLSD